MSIQFSCPKCGTRFRVAAEFAGKKARCQNCGHRQVVPQPIAAEVAASGRFRLSRPEAGAAAEPEAELGDAGLRLPSFANLAEITRWRVEVQADVRDEELEDSGPDFYQIHDKKGKRDSRETRRQRRNKKGLNPLQKIQRKGARKTLGFLYAISDIAFLIAIPVFFLFLLFVLIDQPTWAKTAGVVVIVASAARFVINGLCLVVLPFKYGVVPGVLFFIPPLTFYFLYKHWRTHREALFKFVNPLLPIAGVALVLYFVPTLSVGEAGDEPDADTPAARVDASITRPIAQVRPSLLEQNRHDG